VGKDSRREETPDTLAVFRKLPLATPNPAPTRSRDRPTCLSSSPLLADVRQRFGTRTLLSSLSRIAFLPTRGYRKIKASALRENTPKPARLAVYQKTRAGSLLWRNYASRNVNIDLVNPVANRATVSQRRHEGGSLG
jgi:hypothetical protein